MSSDSLQTNPDALLALCKASADGLRLSILRVLSQNSFGVLELCRVFDTKQSGMSHHLKILASAGLVTTRREGNSIFYRRAAINDDGLMDVQHALLNAADKLPLTNDTLGHINTVQQERAARSLAFFKENAEKFKQHQEQIIAYDVYGPNAIELIKSQLNDTPKRALEVGPGEGAFLAELSPLFKDVYALDNSEQMLAMAESFCQKKQLSNIHFIHGDTGTNAIEHNSIDCIAINMVLHHVPSPAEIFTDLASLLKTGGQVFVTDLCSHDQSWVQDACGDLWLGLEPEDLSQWANNAELAEGESIYLTQRNGFRIQIRQFLKT
jgi:ArsR family transcriptional regulator